MSDLSFEQFAREHGLRPVGERPPFFQYLRDAWRWRAFALTLARYRIQSENEQNRLGMVWVVLRPLLQALMYGLIFGLILDKGTRPEGNFIPFLISGVFIFEFFNVALQKGAKAVNSNLKLVQSVSFPRVLLPIAVILEHSYRFVALLVVLMVIIVPFGELPRWSWFGIIPVSIVYGIFNTGLAMVVARLATHLRDLQQILPLLTRPLFYSTGIFFSVDLVLADNPTLLTIAHIMPNYEFVALARTMLIDMPALDPLVWILAPIWAVVAFIFGLVFFWQAEVRYGTSL